MKNKIDEIDEILIRFEDWMHGEDGENVTKAREILNEMRSAVLDDVSGMLPEQTKQHIDLAYLTGVFNVVGIDGLQKELTRLKDIGKNPHNIFSEGNYR